MYFHQVAGRLIYGTLTLYCLLFAAAANAQSAPLASPPQTRFGILYTGWHCLVLQRQPAPYNIAEAIAGRRPWGPVPEFHFWSEPRAGYYCLADRPDVLRQHAEMLRDAGIDFVVFDATNNEYTDKRTPDSLRGVVEPFNKLVEVWNAVPNAPKVVPWAPLTQGGDMLEWMLVQLSAVPRLQFSYEGKPLALVTENETFTTDQGKVSKLERSYTIRRMWSRISRPEYWSFMSQCRKGFRESGGRNACNQPLTTRNGIPEEISIATAYQETYMSLKTTAIPKFYGRTFVRQFQRLSNSPRTPIALISGWNEWMAQRLCVDHSGRPEVRNCSLANDHWADGNKIFVDQYDYEYSRDIEPSKDWPGDFYYRLMAHCISSFRKNQACSETDIPLPKK